MLDIDESLHFFALKKWDSSRQNVFFFFWGGGVLAARVSDVCRPCNLFSKLAKKVEMVVFELRNMIRGITYCDSRLGLSRPGL